MKKFEYPYSAQGDLNIFAIDAIEGMSIPKDIPESAPEKDGNHIVAHSETGHHHIIDGNTARVYNQDEFRSYLRVDKESNVVHLRGFDTHETITLPPGDYLLTRQMEDDGLDGWRRAAD